VREILAANVVGEILCGGAAPADTALSAGAYFAPTLVDDVDPASELAQQEIFGPVLTVNRFADDDEAVALANGTDYGLLAALWTTTVSRAHRLAADLVAGQVFVNTYGAGGGVELPFGGFRQSGYGREKGFEALDAVTATKTVIVSI
jgi:aldehyde dehydrogenase (NAD+)/betaine-aldehyde dehydrogenase